MKIYCFLFFAFLLSGNLSAQIDTVSLKHLDSIPGTYIYFEVDELRNIYGVTKDNELLKIQEGGNIVNKYSNNNLGDLTTIDVSNPFSILLFYRDYQQLFILNRTLTIAGELNFSKNNIWDVKAICKAQSGDIWLWDEGGFQLTKMNIGGKILVQSHDLRLILDKNPHFDRLQTAGSRLYAMEAGKGIFVFDLFGQLDYSIPIEEVDDFFVYQNKLFYLAKNQLLVYSLIDSKRTVLSLSAKTKQQIRLTSGDIWLLNEGRIDRFE